MQGDREEGNWREGGNIKTKMPKFVERLNMHRRDGSWREAGEGDR